jgi:ABC-type enterochelin transport system permease subunit
VRGCRGLGSSLPLSLFTFTFHTSHFHTSEEDLNNLLSLHFGLVCATFTMNTRHLAPCLIDPIPHCAVMGGIFHGFDAMQVNSK